MNNNLIENRQIRVFISSTFRDMQDERDELMKKTFPVLQRKAVARDVTLSATGNNRTKKIVNFFLVPLGREISLIHSI